MSARRGKGSPAQPIPSSRSRPIPFAAGRGRHRVWGHAYRLSDGIAVTLVGGDRPHIGAVAVAIPRPSSADPSRVSPSISVITVVGHKDDIIARDVADRLCRALNRIVVVVAGVHIEGATRADIRRAVANARRAARARLARLP